MQESLFYNTLVGFQYKKWTLSESIAYFIKGAARELNIMPVFLGKNYFKIVFRNWRRKWLVQDESGTYFNIKGAKLPDISNNEDIFKFLIFDCFEDVFLIFAYYGDNYDRATVEKLDKFLEEGTYGYTDGKFDVTVKSGDVVIDAGAWIGDFAAYAVSKGAIVYAFEPVETSFNLLCESERLNGKNFHSIKKGLSNKEGETSISLEKSGVGDSIVLDRGNRKETISITTIDKFVEDNKLSRVDFIKADIEGAERYMLQGATNVLKTFAPKLAICTYHLPDDPEVLERIIKEANPEYTVVHLRKKLFAAVIKN